MIWHSDKSLYQKDCATRIASIMGKLESADKKKLWFDQFLYIFNIHWDKVDNFRIDKYLMFLRFQLNQLLCFLRDQKYESEVVQWY